MSILTTYEEIENAVQSDFVMILAKSHTCIACKSVLDTLKRNVPNLSDISIHEIYIDDMTKFRGDYLIFSVPTILIFSEGKELLRESRYLNYDKITRLIDMF